MPVDQDALAALAARMVVAAASTDAWGTAKSGVAPLLGRGDPEQERRADRRLDQTRDQIQAAAGKELERARADLEAVCRTRLADLLEEQPDAAGELGEVVKQIQAASPGSRSQHLAFHGCRQPVASGDKGLLAFACIGQPELPVSGTLTVQPGESPGRVLWQCGTARSVRHFSQGFRNWRQPPGRVVWPISIRYPSGSRR
jgi:hypothetical protein